MRAGVPKPCAMAALPETSYRGVSYPQGKLLFSCSVVSDSLWPHKLQRARLPCTSLSPSICSNSCPWMPSNHLILCYLRLFLPSIFPSIWVFSNELALCIRWPKYWSLSFSISPSSEYSDKSGWKPSSEDQTTLLRARQIPKYPFILFSSS